MGSLWAEVKTNALRIGFWIVKPLRKQAKLFSFAVPSQMKDAVQSAFERPVMKDESALKGLSLSSLSQSFTFHVYFVAGLRAGPP